MSTNKPWDRPWSMDEIIDNSDRWNLAGDVALLNTLKAFADNLLTKTTEINNNLQNLTNGLDQTGLRLTIAQNEFQSLRNTQFIESRVYEDDESLPQTDADNKAKTEETKDHTEDIRLAALKGLQVLDEYFDKVKVSVSDSEDEDIDLPNHVLRPKDLYIQRPLPYVIGSDEWHKNWHVGLEDSSSDSETEKVSDKFSESDSESDLPIIQDRSQIKGTSDTSSELDFSHKIEPKNKDFFNSSDSENSVQAPISNSGFAEQLAAKLGHVVSQEITEPEVNKRPIQNQRTNYGDIFFDEPPPLDEPKGPFSGGRGLFDDDDDDFPVAKQSLDSPKMSKSRGLFDEESDDDIFAKKTMPVEKQPLFNQEPPALDEKKKPVGGVSIFGGGNLFDKKLLRRQSSSDDEQKEKETEKKKVDLFDDSPLGGPKKPVGGVSIIGGGDFFDKKLLRRQMSSDDEEETKEAETKKVDLFDDDSFDISSKKNLEGENTRRKVNLFDSDEDEDNSLFNDDEKPEKTSPTNLLSGTGVQNVNEGNGNTLFEDEAKSDRSEKPQKKISLFDDDDLFKDDLFSSNTKKSFTSSLFDDIPGDNLFSSEPEEKPKLSGSLFDDVVAIPDNKNSINVVSTESTHSAVSSDTTSRDDGSNLFNNNIATVAKEETDLFQAQNDKPKSSLFDSPPEPDDLFLESPPKTDFRPNMPLFDPSPPPDDEWDTKSDNLSEPEDFAQEFETPTPKTNLFSEEPPALDFEPVAKKPGKLKHNLNINVGALMPGSLPPKRSEKKPDWDVGTSADDVTATSTRTSGTSSSQVTTVSFDEADRVQVLQSVTKDRARVPLNRRPSTRKGRKAALQRSSSDFKLAQDNEDVDVTKDIPKSEIEDEEPSLGRNSVLEELDSRNSQERSSLFVEEIPEDVPQPKTEDRRPSGRNNNSLFDETEDISTHTPKSQTEDKQPNENRNNLLQSPKRDNSNLEQSSLFDNVETDDLFQTSKGPKEDLFETPEKQKKHDKTTKADTLKTSLFDDEDDDDDLFSTKKPISQAKSKKSLFDDDNEDDDDIFKSFSSASVTKPETRAAKEKKVPKLSSVKKLENTKPDDDPLSALLN